MTSISFIKIGLPASVAALVAFGVDGARAASPAAACPGQVSVGATGDMIPAPAGMPLNCTIAFSDGTVDFAGRVTGYAYDSGVATTTIYDQQGQLVGVTNSLGQTIIVGPEKGVLSTVTDPLGHTTTFAYDAAGSVAQVTSPVSSETSYTYDSSERVLTATDPAGVVTTNAYDSQGRMMSSTPSVGNATTNTYDSSGHLITQTVGSDTIMYTYDSSTGRLTEVTDSVGDDTKYFYDSAGNLISEMVTPPSPGTSVTTTYTYDAEGNVKTISESDGGPTTTFTYDADNRVIQMTETMGSVTDTTTYTYDTAGNLIMVTTSPEDDVTKFTYDMYGDVISMTDPNGSVTTFAYSVVPEPSTWAEILLGFAGLAFASRMRLKRAPVFRLTRGGPSGFERGPSSKAEGLVSRRPPEVARAAGRQTGKFWIGLPFRAGASMVRTLAAR